MHTLHVQLQVQERKYQVRKLKKSLPPPARIRNRFVHEYDVLDHSLVLEAAKMAEELISKRDRGLYLWKRLIFVNGNVCPLLRSAKTSSA
jgi:hypothetical protein